MKKILSILIVGILTLSGFIAAGINTKNDEYGTIEKIETITFSEKLVLQEKDEYLTIELEGANLFLAEPGEPMLPVYCKTFEFSSAAKIKGVTCDYSYIK